MWRLCGGRRTHSAGGLAVDTQEHMLGHVVVPLGDGRRNAHPHDGRVAAADLHSRNVLGVVCDRRVQRVGSSRQLAEEGQ